MGDKVVLKVNNMDKSYGKTQVLKDISFSIYENEVVGLIGHNGAGKTTLIESILGLRKGYKGRIEVFEKDIGEGSKGLKRKIGVQLQDSAINGMMKVYECIEFQAAAFNVQVDVDQLLEDFGLIEHKKKHFSKLSGGLQQRLFVLLSIVHNPSLIFYDELTTGLDQDARRGIYAYIRSLKEAGKTIFLSTHFMDETQIMCDRVIMLKSGRIIKNDSPQNLIDNLDYKYILSFSSSNGQEEIIESFRDIEDISQILKEDISPLTYYMKVSTSPQLGRIRAKMESSPEIYHSIKIRQASMVDVYDENYKKEGDL